MNGDRSRLRERLRGTEALLAPGVFSPLQAQIAEKLGFELIYAGGNALSVNLFGRPDLGLTSLNERVDAVRRITDAVETPILVDADTGFGSALTIRQCVHQFERCGVAGLHLEDEAVKNTHDFGSLAASVESMRQRIHVAVDARLDPNFLVFARCNTLRSHGIAETLERAHAYVDAGADGLFVLGMRSDEVGVIGREFPNLPQIYNMSVRGDGAKFTAQEVANFGYRVVIIPNLLSLALARTTQDLLSSVRSSGGISQLLDRILRPDQMDEISGFNLADSLQKQYPLA
jgi:2-methylisocitrate lyase-like PEP mutase family enzyme